MKGDWEVSGQLDDWSGDRNWSVWLSLSSISGDVRPDSMMRRVEAGMVPIDTDWVVTHLPIRIAGIQNGMSSSPIGWCPAEEDAESPSPSPSLPSGAEA